MDPAVWPQWETTTTRPPGRRRHLDERGRRGDLPVEMLLPLLLLDLQGEPGAQDPLARDRTPLTQPQGSGGGDGWARGSRGAQAPLVKPAPLASPPGRRWPRPRRVSAEPRTADGRDQLIESRAPRPQRGPSPTDVRTHMHATPYHGLTCTHPAQCTQHTHNACTLCTHSTWVQTEHANPCAHKHVKMHTTCTPV